MSLIGEENLNQPNLKENSVDEVKLKRRRDANKNLEERQFYIRQRKNEERKELKRKNRFITPEKLVKINTSRRNDKKRFGRQEKRLNSSFIKIDDSDGLLVIVRVSPVFDASKETRDILTSLRLTEDFAVVFARRNPELMRKLILVEPFVAWGTPNRRVINELLTKHAYAMIDGKRTALSDNVMVEDHLGDKNIICIADMENELVTLGPNFDAVTEFLAPFVLDSALTKVESKMLHKNHVDSGNQGEGINKIIDSML